MKYCQKTFLFFKWEGNHEWKMIKKPNIWKNTVMISEFICKKCPRRKKEMFSPYNPEKCITYS